MSSLLVAAAAEAQDVSFRDARRDFDVGPTPLSIVSGDFNGDGVPDLAVAAGGTYPGFDGNISVLLGNGDGGFQETLIFGAGNRPSSIAVGDFDGDGRLDLVVANAGSGLLDDGSVSLLLGNGDGSFQAARFFGPETRFYFVVVGEFNGDGVQDLAATSSAGVSVFLGNGDGSFQAARTFPAGYAPRSMAVGHF